MSGEPGYGGQSEYLPLRRVLVRRPDEAFGAADPLAWHYTGRPDLDRARQEHDALVARLEEAGAEVVRHDASLAGLADAMYVYDPALITDRGAVLLRMGKPLRAPEPDALGVALEAAGVPILGRLRGAASLEAGDTLWLDERTLAVGLGFRTNAEGVRQLGELLGPDVAILPVPLPYGDGPDACLHLKSLISLLDGDLAVVRLDLLPVPFHQELRHRGLELVPVPLDEFPTQAGNVLALGPRDCLMLEGNPATRARLEAAGCRVRTYRGREISFKAEGGPTCLTRPLLRC
jgi:dimethylargininase